MNSRPTNLMNSKAAYPPYSYFTNVWGGHSSRLDFDTCSAHCLSGGWTPCSRTGPSYEYLLSHDRRTALSAKVLRARAARAVAAPPGARLLGASALQEPKLSSSRAPIPCELWRHGHDSAHNAPASSQTGRTFD